MRAIDSSKNQPNRLRFDRDREFCSKFGGDPPNQWLISTQAIALARYGEEGRQFVNVEETMPNCECYPGPLKPTDELIAVNGKVILEPTQHRFEVRRCF